MRGDERRLRMLLEETVALRHQLFERGIVAGRVAPIAEQRELQPALVVVVDRLEELRGIGGMDEDRNLETGARLPERIEIRIVEMEARAVGLARAQAEALADFADADRARLEVGFELRDGFLRPARSHAREVHAGQHTDAVAVRAGANHLQRSRQALARDVVGTDHQPQVQAVHRGDERIQPFGRRDQVHRMAVVIDRRELRLRHRVLRRHQGRMRPVVED